LTGVGNRFSDTGQGLTGQWGSGKPYYLEKTSPCRQACPAGIDLARALAAAAAWPPLDLMEKIKKAQAVRGTRFIHTLVHCPTGWRMPEDQSARSAMQAVASRIFPLYEIVDGTRYRITHESQGLPVREYLEMQGRFRHLSEEAIGGIQQEVDEDWEWLLEMAQTLRRHKLRYRIESIHTLDNVWRAIDGHKRVELK